MIRRSARLLEWVVGLAIIAGMISSAGLSSRWLDWSTPITPEIEATWEKCRDSLANPEPFRVDSTFTLLRSSRLVNAYDESLKRNVQAVKIEYRRTLKRPMDKRRGSYQETLIFVLDDGKPIRSYLEGAEPEGLRRVF